MMYVSANEKAVFLNLHRYTTAKCTPAAPSRQTPRRARRRSNRRRTNRDALFPIRARLTRAIRAIRALIQLTSATRVQLRGRRKEQAREDLNNNKVGLYKLNSVDL
jgi:hypothetical protein